MLSTRTSLALLAPINTLLDVMVEILRTAYLHHFPYCRADDGHHNTNSPIAFSQVCRRWRRLALGMAVLWTCVHVTPPQSKGCPDSEMVKLYLERSRSRAISVSFACHLQPVDQDPAFDVSWETFASTVWPRYQSSWGLFLTQAHRWKQCVLYSTF